MATGEVEGTQMVKNFAVILNRVHVGANLPGEIIPGYQLRKPTDDERVRIHAATTELGGVMGQLRRWGGYAIGDERVEDIYCIEPLVPSGNIPNEGVRRIEQITRLLEPDLDCGLMIFSGMVRHGYTSPIAMNAWWMISAAVWEIDDNYLANVLLIDARMANVRVNFPPVGRSLDLHFELRGLPINTPLYALGLFAVIESLLTKDSEDGRSLTYQIKAKMSLLNRRFDVPLDYSRFGGASEETAWKKLYSWRSSIAHGGQADFGNDLKILGDAASASTFVETATRTLLRYCLQEPQLVQDLRNC